MVFGLAFPLVCDELKSVFAAHHSLLFICTSCVLVCGAKPGFQTARPPKSFDLQSKHADLETIANWE